MSASCRPISSTFPGKYFTGDGCRRDDDGYYWITGRVDDVINVSGHRLGTAEVEIALVLHADVAEAAVVGYPARHQGPGHLRLCHLDAGRRADGGAAQGARRLGAQGDRPDRQPDLIQFAPGLPKTRSGKIMRRILRKIAEDDTMRSAIPRRWPIRRWWTISSPTGKIAGHERRALRLGVSSLRRRPLRFRDVTVANSAAAARRGLNGRLGRGAIQALRG